MLRSSSWVISEARPSMRLASRGCLRSYEHIRRKSSIPSDSRLQQVSRDEQILVSQPRKPRTGSLGSEPWVRPSSLADTLAEHREANRSGKALDGIPIRIAQSVRRLPKPGLKEAVNTKDIIGDGPKKLQLRRLNLSGPNGPKTTQRYGGEEQSLKRSWSITDSLPHGLRMPWISELWRTVGVSTNVSAKQRLDDEVWACDRYLSPTRQEQAVAHEAFSDVKASLARIAKAEGATLDLVGSRATGLDGPLSDLDINLRTAKTVDDVRSLTILREVYKGLKFPASSNHSTSNVIAHAYVRNAKVPIIDGVHVSSGLPFQIQSTQSIYESQEMIKAFIAEYPTARPLFRIVKQILVMRGLATGSHGGLTSYPLFNMIVASLKLGSAARDASAVGVQLLEFLELFSTIDFYSTAIRYRPALQTDDLGFGLTDARKFSRMDRAYDPVVAHPVLRTIKSRPDGPEYLMSFQDPAESNNDLGKSARLIKHVQATFIEAHQQIRRAMNAWDSSFRQGSDMSRDGRPLLSWCLEADYSAFEESRQALRNYAQKLPS